MSEQGKPRRLDGIELRAAREAPGFTRHPKANNTSPHTYIL